MFYQVKILLALVSTILAFPSYDQEQRRSLIATTPNNNNTNKCPLHQFGTALAAANAQAKDRLVQFEQSFPAQQYGRRYKIGEVNTNEVYCDGTNDQKFCNKIHGVWGDLIPRNGSYCAWAMLEFQDPPDFQYGGVVNGMANDNTTQFQGVFLNTVNSLLALSNLTDKVVGAASHTGFNGGSDERGVIPWPIASIIWKNGNQYAKEWIANVHRPSAQKAGYDFGFTFRGHYKAVECDALDGALQANGISLANNFTNLYLGEGLFKDFWNTFVDMDDLTPQFALLQNIESDSTACLTDCVVAPCPDTLPLLDATTPASSLHQVQLGALFVVAALVHLFQH